MRVLLARVLRCRQGGKGATIGCSNLVRAGAFVPCSLHVKCIVRGCNCCPMPVPKRNSHAPAPGALHTLVGRTLSNLASLAATYAPVLEDEPGPRLEQLTPAQVRAEALVCMLFTTKATLAPARARRKFGTAFAGVNAPHGPGAKIGIQIATNVCFLKELPLQSFLFVSPHTHMSVLPGRC